MDAGIALDHRSMCWVIDLKYKKTFHYAILA